MSQLRDTERKHRVAVIGGGLVSFSRFQKL